MRTWGGEVRLSFSNFLADHGIASAAEIGVYSPEGKWLIEGHGVDPDVVEFLVWRKQRGALRHPAQHARSGGGVMKA